MCKFEEIEGWRLSYGKTIREIKNAVHEEVNLGRIYLIISILFAYMGTVSMQAQSCEEGNIPFSTNREIAFCNFPIG